MVLKLKFTHLTLKDEIVYKDQDGTHWIDAEAKKWSNPLLYKVEDKDVKVFIGDLPKYKDAKIDFPYGRMVWSEIGLVITEDLDIIKNTHLKEEAEAFRYLDQLKTKLFCDELINAIRVSKKCLREKLMLNDVKLHCGLGDVLLYKSPRGEEYNFEFIVGKIVIDEDAIRIYDKGDRGCVVYDNEEFDKYCKVIRRNNETVQRSNDTSVPME